MEFTNYLNEDSYLQESYFKNYFNGTIKKKILFKLGLIEENLIKSAVLAKKQGQKEEYLRIKEALGKVISQKEALKKMKYEDNKLDTIVVAIEGILGLLVELTLIGGLGYAVVTGTLHSTGNLAIVIPATFVGISPMHMFLVILAILASGWLISHILVKKIENKASHEAAKIKVKAIINKTNEKIREYMR